MDFEKSSQNGQKVKGLTINSKRKLILKTLKKGQISFEKRAKLHQKVKGLTLTFSPFSDYEWRILAQL